MAAKTEKQSASRAADATTDLLPPADVLRVLDLVLPEP